MPAFSAPVFELRTVAPRVVAGAVAVGALAWVLLGNSDLQIAAPASSPASPTLSDLSRYATDLTALRVSPLFEIVASPSASESAISQADLHVFGVVNTPVRRTALVAGGGEGAVWIVPGQTFHGFSLTDVEPNQAIFNSPSGQTVTINVFADPAHASSVDEPGFSPAQAPASRGRPLARANGEAAIRSGKAPEPQS
jgi:hypothetical protein